MIRLVHGHSRMRKCVISDCTIIVQSCVWVDVDPPEIAYSCINFKSPLHAPTQYAAEIQEFGDGSSRQGVRLTLLKPQLQDSGYYKCTAENQFETTTEAVQLSVWLPGVHKIIVLI